MKHQTLSKSHIVGQRTKLHLSWRLDYRTIDSLSQINLTYLRNLAEELKKFCLTETGQLLLDYEFIKEQRSKMMGQLALKTSSEGLQKRASQRNDSTKS